MNTGQEQTCFRRNKKIAWNELDGRAMLVQLGDERYFHELNSTATCLWKALSQPKDKDALVELLLEEFEVAENVAQQDVTDFLKISLTKEIVEKCN